MKINWSITKPSWNYKIYGRLSRGHLLQIPTLLWDSCPHSNIRTGEDQPSARLTHPQHGLSLYISSTYQKVRPAMSWPQTCLPAISSLSFWFHLPAPQSHAQIQEHVQALARACAHTHSISFHFSIFLLNVDHGTENNILFLFLIYFTS